MDKLEINCLVIGYGSIGSRHACLLKAMGCHVQVVSKRVVETFQYYGSIKEAMQHTEFDYIVISNDTSEHYSSFVELNKLGYAGKLLIEKPVFSRLDVLPKQAEFNNVFVAYNLRFHPVIQKLHAFIQDKKLYSIQAYAGQYLPNWRSGSGYTRCYSASRERGGGAIRDLSHELDYINWLTGGWKRVTAIGGKFSDLRIDSDDVFSLLFDTENCPVISVQMNYLDQKPRREMIINLKDFSIKADLIKDYLEINGETIQVEVDRDLTYELQHKAILHGDFSVACTLEQGMDVLSLISAAELAADGRKWVNKAEMDLFPI